MQWFLWIKKQRNHLHKINDFLGSSYKYERVCNCNKIFRSINKICNMKCDFMILTPLILILSSATLDNACRIMVTLEYKYNCRFSKFINALPFDYQLSTFDAFVCVCHLIVPFLFYFILWQFELIVVELRNHVQKYI